MTDEPQVTPGERAETGGASPFKRPGASTGTSQADGGSASSRHEPDTADVADSLTSLLDQQQDPSRTQRPDIEGLPRTTAQIDGAGELLQPDAVPEPGQLAAQRGGTAKAKLYLRRFLRNYSAVAGVIIFVVVALFGIFGGFFASHEYDDVDFFNLASPPGTEGHVLGTNGAGNDLFAGLAHGIQRSLIIGVLVSLATTVIAAVVGSIAAYIGGTFERIVLEVIHFLLVVPSFLILALVSNKAGGDWRLLILVLIIFGWMFYARVVWTMALSLREREYVAAARYMGLTPLTVVWRHIIPNIGSLLTIHFTLGVVSTIQSETALSFLGFGVKPPDVSLGTLIADGIGNLFSAPWLFWIPAATLTLLTVSMAFIADGLRDALDPNSTAGGHA